MAHPFVHVELMSTDVGKSKSFYGKLFDWTLEDMDMGDMTYTLVKPGEGPGGGGDVRVGQGADHEVDGRARDGRRAVAVARPGGVAADSGRAPGVGRPRVAPAGAVVRNRSGIMRR